MSKKWGFSLAEILITLGVVGVTIAIVLPSLIIRYRHMSLNTKMKKSYSILAQGMQRAVPDGDFSTNINFYGEGEARAETFFNEYFKPYFRVVNVCGYNKEGCWAQTHDRSNNPVGQSYGMDDSFTFILSDGSAVCLKILETSQAGYISETLGVDVSKFVNVSAYPVVYIDTNAKRSPNTLGKDVHLFVLTERGFVPAGRKAATDSEIWSECSETGYFCFEGILRNNWAISPNDNW